jgi:hypothetical protein
MPYSKLIANPAIEWICVKKPHKLLTFTLGIGRNYVQRLHNEVRD